MFSHHFDVTDSEITYCVRSSLAFVLAAQGPISLNALIPIISPPHNLSEKPQPLVLRTTRRLGQLFSDGRETDGQIGYPQGNFLLSLIKRASPSPFFPTSNTHEEMALICLRIMATELRFNIGRLSSSFIRNADIEGLADITKANISPHLLLACRIWTYHISQLERLGRMLVEMIYDFFRFHFPYWLEVMSLTNNAIRPTLAQLRFVSELAPASVFEKCMINTLGSD